MTSRNKFKFTKAEITSFAIAIALLVGLCVYGGDDTIRITRNNTEWQAKADSLDATIKAEKAQADSLKRLRKAKKHRTKSTKSKSKKTTKPTPRNYLDEVIN